MGKNKNILVVDDDRAFAESLAGVLVSWGYRTVIVHDAAAGLAAATSRDIDCALIDYNLGATQGTSLLLKLRDAAVQFPSIMITGYGDVRTATTAMKNGAVDFVEKPFEPDELRRAIEEAIGQRRDRSAAEDTIAAARNKLNELSQREAEIVDAIVAGRSSKQIADTLGISQRTVEAHRANILEKLALANTASLVRLAVLASLGPH